MKYFKSTISILIAVWVLSVSFAGLAVAQSAVDASSSVSAESITRFALLRQLIEQASIQDRAIDTFLMVIFGYVLVLIVVAMINRRVKDIKSRHTIRKNITYVYSFVIIIAVLLLWVRDMQSISLFLGVAGAGRALALQEAIMCVAGWFLILFRRPFELGDRIQIGDVKGDVIDIRLFQSSLLEIGNWVDADQSTGRIVNIPNSFVFKKENFNYSRGFEFIWNELPILVTFESDWQKGRDIMLKHAQTMTSGMEEQVQRKLDVMRNRYMIYYGKLTPIVYVNIKDSGVELTLRYLTEAKKRRSTQDAMCQNILNEFVHHPEVNFAYPTYRIVKE